MLEDGEEDSIPLPTIKQKTLEKIIDYCKWVHENKEPEIPPLRSNQLNDIISDEWLQKYVQVDKDFLFELALGANFLDIQSLLELVSATIAS